MFTFLSQLNQIKSHYSITCPQNRVKINQTNTMSQEKINTNIVHKYFLHLWEQLCWLQASMWFSNVKVVISFIGQSLKGGLCMINDSIHYIILNNGILKSNSLIFPRSEGYITQYTPKGLYRLIVNTNNVVNVCLLIVKMI